MASATPPPSRGRSPFGRAMVTYGFALTMLRHPDGRFCLVRETRGRGMWLPGGRVEPGESFSAAAVREAREEAGVDVALTGVLRVEHAVSPPPPGATHCEARMRVIFLAAPVDPAQPLKSTPDAESEGAQWCSLADIEALGAAERLRGPEPLQWARYLSAGRAVAPLSFLVDDEGAEPA
jgi:8-oxo-dGTP pyrophosphatase MutT (NUDIX family)